MRKLTRIFTRRKAKKRKKGGTARRRREEKLEKQTRIFRQFYDLLFDPVLTGRKKQKEYAERKKKYDEWREKIHAKAERLVKAKKKYDPLEKEADLKQGDRIYAKKDAWHGARSNILVELRRISKNNEFKKALDEKIIEFGKKPNSPPYRVRKQFYEFLKRAFEEGGFALTGGGGVKAFFREYLDKHFPELSTRLY